jgi:hypothetical protein
MADCKVVSETTLSLALRVLYKPGTVITATPTVVTSPGGTTRVASPAASPSGDEIRLQVADEDEQLDTASL